jgi:phosphate transport system protein
MLRIASVSRAAGGVGTEAMTVTAPQGDLGHVERSALEHALQEAERQALAEFGFVREWLAKAVEAAINADAALADQVVASAGELERRYGEVHERLLAVIALQAPVASDLRLAIALLHVNDRLARMGAQTVNVATLCGQMPSEAHPSEEQLACLREMARLVDEQVAEAQRVLAERDVEASPRLREHDQAINEHNRRCFAMAIKDGEDEQRREAGFFVALMARALERVGDNAVDIGRQAAFAATGRLQP